jgi:hypothetical protein
LDALREALSTVFTSAEFSSYFSNIRLKITDFLKSGGKLSGTLHEDLSTVFTSAEFSSYFTNIRRKITDFLKSGKNIGRFT